METSIARIEAATRPALATPTATLAELLSALGVGSPCLCCGSSLSSLLGDQGGSWLRCPACGAEIVTENAVLLLQAA
jgi:hypothetical protein